MTLRELVNVTDINGSNIALKVRIERGSYIAALNMSKNPLRDFIDYEVSRVEIKTKATPRMDGTIIVEPTLLVYVFKD